MPMLTDPSTKYRPFKPIDLPDRQWPNKTLSKVPRWLATDLRDGNQSLVDPMDSDQKFRYFKTLVDLGYKEIEVSFPAASDTDYAFTRRLIETPGAVPDDVWLQVLSPCRPELIQRTVQSLQGAKKGIIHLYLATSACFQRIVFGHTQEQGIDLAVKCTALARRMTKDDPSQSATEWQYEFSPETFSDSSPEYVLRVCEAVKEAWGPTEACPIIFNLPATVEMSTPNVYADQIEYFCRHISEREKVCVSLHPHNDRGCAVAAAELAQMAGADRVEGTLFGNGERTGNVDLVTLALNLYTQGIHPKIDFSDINAVIDVVEESTKIPVHARAPYGGQLVVCAFSGSHQDAINKGFKEREQLGTQDNAPWQMPYLPLDPKDIGRNYEAIIRVNSQSGKGGVAWIIQRALELDLPRGLQIAFSRIVQARTDTLGRELLAREIQTLFEESYMNKPRFTLLDYDVVTDRATSPHPHANGLSSLSSSPADTRMDGAVMARKNSRSQNTQALRRHFSGVITDDQDPTHQEYHIKGSGNGPISALANALRSLAVNLDVGDYKEHAIGKGRDVRAATYIECIPDERADERIWGVAVNTDTVQASLLAYLSAAGAYMGSRALSPVKEELLGPGIPVPGNATATKEMTVGRGRPE